MARILGDLTVQLQAGDAKWRLGADLEFHVGGEFSVDVVAVPAGFLADAASLPWPARLLLLGARGAARAAAIHGYLSSPDGRRAHACSRAQADAVLIEALRVTGCPLWPLVWLAVRILGAPAYRRRGASA